MCVYNSHIQNTMRIYMKREQFSFTYCRPVATTWNVGRSELENKMKVVGAENLKSFSVVLLNVTYSYT